MDTEVPDATITMGRADLTSAEALALISALNAELSMLYPEEGANHFRLDPDDVAPGRGAFLMAWRDGKPIACGAVRRLNASDGELKRMYVIPEERGRQLGKRVLAALEQEARALGVTRLLLETGTRQEAAVALYRRGGFVEIERYGEYTHSPLSFCMAKELASL